MSKFPTDNGQDGDSEAQAGSVQASETPGTQPPAALDGDPVALARLLAQDAEDLGIDLDFTPASLPALDRLLADDRSLLAESPEATRQDDEKWVSLKIGAYLGEVIRRSIGGTWTQERDGAPALALFEHLAPTVRIVRGLLLDGCIAMPGGRLDSVVEYYRQADEAQRVWLDGMVRGSRVSLDELAAEMTDDKDLASWLISQARTCVKIARLEWDVVLDFSADSVGSVESVLGKIHTRFANAKVGERPAEGRIEATVKTWGVYVGEVLRREHGGKWCPDSEDGTAHLVVGGARVFPLAKVRKRLLNGPIDALPFYFRAVAKALQREA